MRGNDCIVCNCKKKEFNGQQNGFCFGILANGIQWIRWIEQTLQRMRNVWSEVFYMANWIRHQSEMFPKFNHTHDYWFQHENSYTNRHDWKLYTGQWAQIDTLQNTKHANFIADDVI